jgi:hypothetical protein
MSNHEQHKAGLFIDSVPAIAGLVYAAAAAVQFLDAQIALGVIDWTFQPELALLVSLAALVVAFASSETRNWAHYDNAEQALIALNILIMLSHQYTQTVATAVSNNQPLAGAVAFGIGMVAWGVLSR